MSNNTDNSQAIIVGNDLGRKKITFRAWEGDGSIVTLPTHVFNYSALVSALVRTKYSESDVEAIVSNSLLLMQNPSSISDDDASEKVNEFQQFQEFREQCKARAKELLQLGTEMGLEEMY